MICRLPVWSIPRRIAWLSSRMRRRGTGRKKERKEKGESWKERERGPWSRNGCRVGRNRGPAGVWSWALGASRYGLVAGTPRARNSAPRTLRGSKRTLRAWRAVLGNPALFGVGLFARRALGKLRPSSRARTHCCSVRRKPATLFCRVFLLSVPTVRIQLVERRCGVH